MDTATEQLAQRAADLIKLETIPDSRLSLIHTPKGARFIDGIWWVPCFCAGCGRGGSRVPQDSMDFVCWLCNDCAPKYGHFDGFYGMPDEQFYARVHLEMLEHYGRILSPGELEAVVDADASPLARLITQGR